MPNIKAALFDLDGTLVNTMPDIVAAVNDTLAAFGFPTQTPEELNPLVGYGARTLVKTVLPEFARDEATISRVLAAYIQRYNSHPADRAAPYDGMPERIGTLRRRGIKTAVVTNKPEGIAKQLIELFYPGAFDTVVGEGEDRPPKPSPVMASLAMQKLGVTPDVCVFVGDSAVDVETARAAGMPCIGVLWGFRGKEELIGAGADFLCERPEEILRCMEDRNTAE